MNNKIVSPAEAAAIVRSGDTVSVAGFVGIGTPDELLIAIEAALSRGAGASGTDPGVRRRTRGR